jgi:hypothetical protein
MRNRWPHLAKYPLRVIMGLSFYRVENTPEVSQPELFNSDSVKSVLCKKKSFYGNCEATINPNFIEPNIPVRYE